MDEKPTISCFGSQREHPNAPLMLLFRVGTEKQSSVYPLTVEDAMRLKRSIEDFLAAANIPTR